LLRICWNFAKEFLDAQVFGFAGAFVSLHVLRAGEGRYLYDLGGWSYQP
jgi:hypothetical protein